MLIDLNGVFGIVASALAIFAYLKSARMDVLKAEIERLCGRVKELETKIVVLETQRDEAHAEAREHFAARTAIADENRELHNENRTLHREILMLTRAGAALDNRLAAHA